MPTSYALLSTYPPTQCGLATFTAALLTHLGQPGDQVAVVRVLDEPAPPSPAEPGEVVHDLVAGSAASASAAAEVLNGFDVVIVQHEYGIYGGPDGQDVISLLEALQVPSIVVLHTVLAHPTPRQRMILDEKRALTEPGLSARMSSYSADLAPQMLWPAVARSYRELASLLIGARAGTPV